MSFWSALTDGVVSWEIAKERALRHLTRHRPRVERWKVHYANRLAYERAMLGESGGLASDQVKPERGGAVKCWSTRGGYEEIVKVNAKSVTIMDDWGNGGRRFARNIPFDKLQEVKSRAEWLAMQGKPADTPEPAKPKMPPLCNYRAPDCIEMTEEEWKRTTRATDFAHIRSFPATAEHGAHRVRTHARGTDNYARRVVFLTDKPVKDLPGVTA